MQSSEKTGKHDKPLENLINRFREESKAKINIKKLGYICIYLEILRSVRLVYITLYTYINIYTNMFEQIDKNIF